MIILMMMVIKNDDNDDESYTSDKSYTCVSGDVLPVPMAMAMIFFNSVQEKYIQEGGGSLLFRAILQFVQTAYQ